MAYDRYTKMMRERADTHSDSLVTEENDEIFTEDTDAVVKRWGDELGAIPTFAPIHTKRCANAIALIRAKRYDEAAKLLRTKWVQTPVGNKQNLTKSIVDSIIKMIENAFKMAEASGDKNPEPEHFEAPASMHISEIKKAYDAYEKLAKDNTVEDLHNRDEFSDLAMMINIAYDGVHMIDYRIAENLEELVEKAKKNINEETGEIFDESFLDRSKYDLDDNGNLIKTNPNQKRPNIIKFLGEYQKEYTNFRKGISSNNYAGANLALSRMASSIKNLEKVISQADVHNKQVALQSVKAVIKITSDTKEIATSLNVDTKNKPIIFKKLKFDELDEHIRKLTWKLDDMKSVGNNITAGRLWVDTCIYALHDANKYIRQYTSVINNLRNGRNINEEEDDSRMVSTKTDEVFTEETNTTLEGYYTSAVSKLDQYLDDKSHNLDELMVAGNYASIRKILDKCYRVISKTIDKLMSYDCENMDDDKQRSKYVKELMSTYKSRLDKYYKKLESLGENGEVASYFEEADEVFTEAGLAESYTFQRLDKSASIAKRIAEIIHTGTVVGKEYIEDQYNQIAKTRLSPLADAVLSAFDDGTVRLIYNKNVHLTVALPFTVMQVKGRPVATIFIADYCGLTKDGSSLNIDMKKLYTLMESAYVATKYYTNEVLFSRNSTVARLTAETYAEMGLRILNKEFALSLDKEKHDSINYAIARYYLQNVLGVPNSELIDSYARGVCKSPDNVTMKLISGVYDGKEINTIEELIKFFPEINPSMERLTFRYFFERWIASYGIGATLAMDNFPYLYYVMASVLLGSFMINNVALNDLIKNMKGMEHFYGEIQRIVGG